jgi:hypothetical protein
MFLFKQGFRVVVGVPSRNGKDLGLHNKMAQFEMVVKERELFVLLG